MDSYKGYGTLQAPNVTSHNEAGDPWYSWFGDPFNKDFSIINMYYYSDYDWRYWWMTLWLFPAFYFFWLPWGAPIAHVLLISMFVYFMVDTSQIDNPVYYVKSAGDTTNYW